MSEPRKSSSGSVFGRGVTGRMAAHPLLIWIIGFGGYFMGSNTFQMGAQNRDLNCALQCTERKYT